MAVQRRKRSGGTQDPTTGNATGDSQVSDLDNPRGDVSSQSNPTADSEMESSLSIFSEPATDKQSYRGLENSVSLFGNLDAAQVNDDPFWIEPNTYWAICIDATIRQNENGDNALSIQWQIDQPDSDYHEKKLSDYFTLVPMDESLTPEEAWKALSASEKDKVKWLKRRLRRAFGVPESELNTVKPSQLVGCGAFIEIVEGKGKEGTKNAGKKFSNIRDAANKQLFEEENGKVSEASSSVGLL